MDLDHAHQVVHSYHNGLIEVTHADEAGKDKMRKAFDWILKAALRERSDLHNYVSLLVTLTLDQGRTGLPSDSDYQNPASPDVLKSTYPWSESTTPTASPSISALNLQSSNFSAQSNLNSQMYQPPTTPTPRAPGPPLSPTRTRSTGDLLMESERARSKSIAQEAPYTTNNISNGSSSPLEPPSSSTIPGSATAADVPRDEFLESLDEPAKAARDKES